MAIRKINFTGRTRITRDDVHISLEEAPGYPPRIDIELDLDDYGFPPHARVFVEAYRPTRWMRFDCGTVGNIRYPGNMWLSEFDSGDAVRFRVCVTDPDESIGLLLGSADRLLPREHHADVESLLPVRASKDLGDQVFKVEFDPSPALLINWQLGDWRTLMKTKLFSAIVYPQVLREVLTRICWNERGEFDPDNFNDWQSRWLHMAGGLVGEMPDPDANDDERDREWIDDVVLAFSEVHKCLNAFREGMSDV